MKKLEFLPLAQIASFLALFAFFMGYYLSFTLFDFLPPVSGGGGAAMTIYLLNFAGTALGTVLCPLFLRNKSGIGFILLVTLPQIVVRSLGVELWFGTPAVMVILAISSGILYTLAHGLFFLIRTGWSWALFLAFATCGGILARYFSVSLLESSGLASDPPRVIGLLINIIKWA